MSIEDKTKFLLKNYVEKNFNLPELQWDEQFEDLKLPFDRYHQIEKVRVAYYFFKLQRLTEENWLEGQRRMRAYLQDV
jgi:hypothetical protein